MYSFLKTVLLFFKQKSIEAYAAYGTLLGLVRNEALLEHDDDLDFIVARSSESKLKKLLNKEVDVTHGGISNKAVKVVVRETLDKRGQPVHGQYYIVEVSQFNEEFNWPFVDLFLENTTWKSNRIEHLSIKDLKNPNRIIEIPVPENRDSILNMEYGSDWKRVIKNVDYHLESRKELVQKCTNYCFDVETGNIIKPK